MKLRMNGAPRVVMSFDEWGTRRDLIGDGIIGSWLIADPWVAGLTDVPEGVIAEGLRPDIRAAVHRRDAAQIVAAVRAGLVFRRIARVGVSHLTQFPIGMPGEAAGDMEATGSRTDRVFELFDVPLIVGVI